jgi:hypothetical protein
MSHLPETRLLTLGLEVESLPSPDEAAHLRDCASCAGFLASERELSRALATVTPRVEPPADFVARTTARFQAARAVASHDATAPAAQLLATPLATPRRSFRPVAWALAASVALAVPALGLLAADAGDVVQHLVIGAKNAMVLISALALVASKVPLGPLFVAASSATVLVAWSLAMSRLVNLGSREISGTATA